MYILKFPEIEHREVIEQIPRERRFSSSRDM